MERRERERKKSNIFYYFFLNFFLIFLLFCVKGGRGRGDLHVSLDPSRGSNTTGNGVKGKEDTSKLPRWMTQSADHFMLSRQEEASTNNSNTVNPPPTAASAAPTTAQSTNSLKTSNSNINNSLSSSTNALHTGSQASKDPIPSDINDQTPDSPVSWVYIGDRGEIQGPFTSEKMLNWFNKKLLPLTLNVKRTTDSTFTSLADLSHGGTRNPFETQPVIPPPSNSNQIPQNPNPLRSSMPSLSKLQPSSPFNPIPLSNDIPDPSNKNSVYDFQSLMGITDAIENHVSTFPQEDSFLSRFAQSPNPPPPNDAWNTPAGGNPGNFLDFFY